MLGGGGAGVARCHTTRLVSFSERSALLAVEPIASTPAGGVAGTRARHWAVDAYESGHLVHYDYYTALDGPWPLRIVTDVGVQAFEPGGVKAGVPSAPFFLNVILALLALILGPYALSRAQASTA